MSTFTERLSSLIICNCLTHKTVASEINVSRRAFQYYAHGEREPSMSVLIALADLFDVSIDYLVGRSDDPKRR